MKAVWFNSVGEVFDIIDDLDGVSVLAKMPHVWNVIEVGDTIKFVDDEEDQFKIGGTYDKMRTA
jgi:hypothetical protein